MNRYGVDTDYFKKKLELVIRDLEHYKPTELHTELERLAQSVRPNDKCFKCGGFALVVFDEGSNKCLKCQNIQKVKGT